MNNKRHTPQREKNFVIVLILFITFSLYPKALLSQKGQINQGSGIAQNTFVMPKAKFDIIGDGILGEKVCLEVLEKLVRYKVVSYPFTFLFT